MTLSSGLIYKWRNAYWIVFLRGDINVACRYLGFLTLGLPEEGQHDLWVEGVGRISNPLEIILLVSEGEVVAPFPYTGPER